MSEFTERQQLEIAQLAQAAFKRTMEDQAVLKDTGGKLVAAALPMLSRCEKWVGNLWSVMGIVVAMPLAYFGLQAMADQRIQKGLETQVSQKLEDEKGPLKSRLLKFDAFKGTLTNQFADNVDSATSKLLRFGCSTAGASELGDGFAPCASGTNSGSSRARDVQEVHEQTLLFKANPSKQQVLLRLSLTRIDELEMLQKVALRLESLPLLSTGGGGKRIELKPSDLPETHDFVTSKGQLRLYGPVANLGDREPLRVEIKLNNHLLTQTDLHVLRLWAEPLQGPEGTGARGSERFFLQAMVVVTHKLPKD